MIIRIWGSIINLRGEFDFCVDPSNRILYRRGSSTIFSVVTKILPSQQATITALNILYQAILTNDQKSCQAIIDKHPEYFFLDANMEKKKRKL